MGREWALPGTLAGQDWDWEECSLAKHRVGKAALWRASAGHPQAGRSGHLGQLWVRNPRPGSPCWRLSSQALVLVVVCHPCSRQLLVCFGLERN